MLDENIKSQLNQYLQLLENPIELCVSVTSDEVSKDMLSLVNELASLSPQIKVKETKLARTPSFSVNKPGTKPAITFAGVPLGHEFNSLILAILQVSGRPPKTDKKILNRIKSLKGHYNFETYISLTCHNCPDVVQSLNLMSVINPNITHTMIDGYAFKEEVELKNIMAVPTIYLNGEFLSSGRISLEEILEKLDNTSNTSESNNKEPFDILVVGGGPAGVSAAIYSVRKGIRTGIVAERFGGQVLDTLGIENLIGTKYTEGPKLAASLEEHAKQYPIDIMVSNQVVDIKKKDFIELTLENGTILKSKAVVISTGAKWKNIGIPGEFKFKNKGVAYCPHCDGPLFKGKDVAVIGGGNSGIEAAIDLAGIANHVTVFEFMPELKADLVLQNRLYKLPNVTVLKNVQTKEILGSDKVTAISYIDIKTGEVHQIELSGIFVQIGLSPNTEWIGDTIHRNSIGEIIVDIHGATNIPGIFSAGDCTNTPYKQIIISMGSGATAALSAFDYLIRS